MNPQFGKTHNPWYFPRHATFFFLTVFILLLVGCAAPEQDVVETAVPTPTSLPPTQPIPTNTPAPTTSPTIQPTLANTPPPPFAPPPIHYLAAAIEQTLADFDGLSSYIITDLSNGDTISHNPDLAIAGMSLIKIPILIETYHTLDNPPNIEQTKLITQTTALSSNFAANLLLQEIAGFPDSYAGADTVTTAMRDLGFFNTFITVPYTLDPRPDRLNTFITPANQRTDITTRPDPYRQTTIADLTQLMAHLYTCAEQNSGLLREAYGDQLTPSECQELLQMMQLNELARLFENGFPNDTTFAHKVGWIDDTYGDVGIVYGAERDFLIGMALYTPEWLEWSVSSPLFTQVAQQAYAHFNDADAYTAVTLAQPPQLNNTPTPIPTPAFPQALIFGTQGIGLTVRDVPNGETVAILPEGSVVSLLDTPPIFTGTIEWQQIESATGVTGWVSRAFLVQETSD